MTARALLPLALVSLLTLGACGDDDDDVTPGGQSGQGGSAGTGGQQAGGGQSGSGGQAGAQAGAAQAGGGQAGGGQAGGGQAGGGQAGGGQAGSTTVGGQAGAQAGGQAGGGQAGQSGDLPECTYAQLHAQCCQNGSACRVTRPCGTIEYDCTSVGDGGCQVTPGGAYRLAYVPRAPVFTCTGADQACAYEHVGGISGASLVADILVCEGGKGTRLTASAPLDQDTSCAEGQTCSASNTCGSKESTCCNRYCACLGNGKDTCATECAPSANCP